MDKSLFIYVFVYSLLYFFYTEKKLLFLLNYLRISKKSSTFAAESRLKNVH